MAYVGLFILDFIYLYFALIDIGLVDSSALRTLLARDGCYLENIFLEASIVNASVSKIPRSSTITEPESNSSKNGPKPLKFS